MSCAYDRKSFLEAFGGWEWRADWGDVTFMIIRTTICGLVAGLKNSIVKAIRKPEINCFKNSSPSLWVFEEGRKC